MLLVWKKKRERSLFLLVCLRVNRNRLLLEIASFEFSLRVHNEAL